MRRVPGTRGGGRGLAVTAHRLGATVLGVLALVGCSRADLELQPESPPPPRDDKLTVRGGLCTRAPDRLVFPLRVLFVVDGSESMQVSDPPDPVTGETGRERALRQTWTRLLDAGADGVRIGVTRFSAQAQTRTAVDEDGDSLPDTFFTDDVEALDDATVSLRQTDRTTNYINAIDEAYFVLRTEMLRAELESLPLSKYAVVFISDGVPDETGDESRRNADDAILEGVRGLQELADLFRVGDFAFHTIYVADERIVAQSQRARDLLERMAEAGGGTYRNVPDGDSLSFIHIDLSIIRRVFTLRSLVAVNTHLVQDSAQRPVALGAPFDAAGFVDLDGGGALDCGEPLVDSDADGLADLVEYRIGSDPLDPDTDGDGLRDRIEWSLGRSGLDPLDGNDADCESAADSDGDTLGDCEEIFVGTRDNGADTDADGLPDAVEFRFGTSAVESDRGGDLDFDNTPTVTEVQTGTDPLCDDASTRSRTAFRYLVSEEGTVGASTCYDFEVSNVTLTATQENTEAEVPGNGWNRVLLFAGEVAFDDPDTFARYRVACVEARYTYAGPGDERKDPPSGQMRLDDTDFVDLEDFDPDAHCTLP